MSRFEKMHDTIDHEYVEGRLSAYLDGELPSQEKEVVDRHLAVCQACQWQLDTLRQTVQWMGEMPAVPIPRVFTIPAPAQPVPQRRWNFLPVLQGAAALIALVLVVVVAGDIFFSGFSPRAVPQSAHDLEGAPALPQATRAVSARDEAPVAEAEVAMEEEAEAPLALDVMPTPEEALMQTEAAAQERTAEKSQAPVSATEAPMMSAAAPPPPPEGGGVADEAEAPLSPQAAAPEAGAVAPEAEAAAPEAGAVAPEAEAAAPTEGAVAPTADAATRDSDEPISSPTPTAAWTVTAVAEIEEAAPRALGAEDEQPLGALLRPSISWLRVIEVGLVAVLALLLPAILVAILQRRRSQ